MKSRSRDGLAAKGPLVPVLGGNPLIVGDVVSHRVVMDTSFFLFHQTWKHKRSSVAHGSNDILSGLSKRLRVAGEMGKVTGEIFYFCFS